MNFERNFFDSTFGMPLLHLFVAAFSLNMTYTFPLMISLRSCACSLGLAVFVFIAGCGGGSSSSNTGGNTGGNTTNPTVTSVSPASVMAGSSSLTLTVNGTGFTNGATVEVGGIADQTVYVSATQLTATVTAAQLTNGGQLSVIVVNGDASSGSGTPVNLAVTNPAPTIASVTPSVELAGAAAPVITVTGTGFVPSTVIQVNGSNRTTAFINTTEVNVTLTAADVASSGSLSLTAVNPAPGGGASTAATVAVNNPTPVVNGVSPQVVLTGTTTPTTVTVTGTNFTSASTVELGGVATATTYVSATQLTFQLTVAEQATSQQILVGVMNPAPGGGTGLGAWIDILPPAPTPAITRVSPSQFNVGSGPTTITVYGSNLVPTPNFPVVSSSFALLWNGTALTAQQWGSSGYGTEFITATVPASLLTALGNATIEVSNSTATPPLSNALTVSITNPPPPTLTSTSPSAGPINTATAVTLYGTGFTAGSTVALNGTNIASTFVSSTELTTTIPASSVALPGNVNLTVTTPGPGGGTSASLPYTAYIAIPNNGMVYNPVNGLLYVSVPGSAGTPYGNSVVSVDPETGALGAPILVGSEPDQLAISSDGTTLWVGLDGASAVREVNLITGTAGMQFSLANNSGTYAFPPIAHALAVLPGYPNSIVMSSALNQYVYEDMLGIYDSGVPRTDFADLSSISTLPAIFISPTKAEVYATSYESGYQVFSYNSSGLQYLAGNTGTDNFGAAYGTALQVDNGVAYLDSGLALNAETGALLGTFYSSGTTVATGPMVSDSSLGKLFILENTGSTSTPNSAVIQAFNESNFAAIASGSLQVNGALAGTRYGAGDSTATELDGNNPINTMVRWGADGLAFRAANGVFSFRSSIVQNLATVSADLDVGIVVSGANTTGKSTIYTATITNAGPSASTNVALTASIPSTGVLLSVTPSSGACSSSGNVSCDLGALSSGSSVTVTFVVSQMTAGAATLSAQVTASENDPNLTNNQASSTVTVTGSDYNPSPTVVSVTPAAILAGSSATEIAVTGSGFTSASSILVGGVSLPTTQTSSTQLTAVVPAANLASLGWTPVSVTTPGPGGGNSANLPLTIFSVISLDANHILYDPYSRNIMASIASGATTVAPNSLVAITPSTGAVGTPIPIGSQPEKMALTDDGQILYTLLAGSDSVARFNMLSQQLQFTASISINANYGAISPRDIAAQPGTENTVVVDLGEDNGNAIFDFDPTAQSAAIRGSTSGPYTGSCLQFLDADDMFAFDIDTTGATFDHYTITSTGFSYYSNFSTSTLNNFGCFKLSGGLAFANAGGVANPATAPATQLGVFPGLSSGGTFSGLQALAPDTSLQQAFFMANTTGGGALGILDGIAAYDQFNYLPSTLLSLDMETIEGNTSYTPVDLIRWGQDGLAVLTSGGHIYLLRGPVIAPEELNSNSAAILTSSSIASATHGSGNMLLTLAGSNFIPGVAVTWNGSYRTTTIVDATHVTVAIPASDLAAAGSGSLVATNPGGPASNTLTVTIN